MADSSLISRAEQIRTETGAGKNTPERVGSLLVDMCKQDEAAKTAAEEAKSAAQTAGETASAAQAAAETAQSAADAVSGTAEAAKTAAEEAKSAAQTAGETASAAQTAAETAQSAADAVSGTAEAAKTAAEEAKSAAQAAGEKAEANATAIAEHGERLSALEAPEAYTYAVAVAKADGGTLTIGSNALTLRKGVNRWTLAPGQEGFALDADAKANLTSLSLTGAKVKARADDLYRFLDDGSAVRSLHLPALDVSAVTRLSYLCQYAGSAFPSKYGKLAALTGIEDWDTGKVTSMGCMLASAACLQSVDLSRWDTSACESFASMLCFTNYATSLTSVGDLSAWDTSKCKTFAQMFGGCTGLTYAGDLSQWDTSSATSLGSMFMKSGFYALDLSTWDTRKVTDIGYLFYGSTLLQSVDVSGWDLQSCTVCTSVCAGCTGLTTLKLGEGWGKMPGSPTLDLSALSKWTGDTVLTLCALYDRTQDSSLGTMAIKLHANTYAKLGTDNISALSAKGYTVTK